MGWLDRAVKTCLTRSPEGGAPAPNAQARITAPDPHNLPAFLEPHLDEFVASYLADLHGPQLRASELLFRVLPPREIMRFLIYRVVVARHEDGGYYQIALGRQSNVTYHDVGGRARIIYCAVPGSEMQAEDVVAAQYLALLHNREAFMQAANWQLAP